MTDRITLTLPDELENEIRRIADEQSESIEAILIARLRVSILSPDIQSEIDDLQYLSDDALWTIAQEQLTNSVQDRAELLLTHNNQGSITESERQEFHQLNERANKLMLRKAEAASILRKRGHHFSQKNFKQDA